MIGQRMRGTLMPTDIAFDGVSETKAHSAAKITSTKRKGHGIAPGAPELSKQHLSVKERNDPRVGLASPNHTANLSGLVLGCMEADVCK